MQNPWLVRLLVLLSTAGFSAAQPVGLRAQQIEESPMEKHLADSKFAPIPNAPDCFLAVIEHGQPDKEASVMLMKASTGCAVPWHWHISNEQIMMLKGTARAQVRGDKDVVLQSGDYFLVPPHHVMRFACATSCTLFVYTGGPFEIHYVDESGKEISPEEALKGLKKGK
jgi:quercetin dioxygenase-like cupin family protein